MCNHVCPSNHVLQKQSGCYEFNIADCLSNIILIATKRHAYKTARNKAECVCSMS